MSETVRKFVWYDLMTSDLKAAGEFYGKVVGWGTMDSGIVERPYHIFTKGQSMIGGLMPIPPDAAGMPPTWMGYIGVDNVDAYVKRVTDAGGQVVRAAEDIPNGIGRFAIVADPHGVKIALFSSPAGDPPKETLHDLGHVGWHELQAGDLESAWAFYSGLFGWEKSSGFDMGPMGEYRIFNTGGSPAGGIMTKMAEAPVPFWLFYFNVDDINTAVDRIKEAGGKILNGPMEVPGGQWIVQGFDPQGAMFAVVTPPKQ